MKTIVYKIEEISTGKVLYIGKTKNFEIRKYQHLLLKTHTKDWLSEIGVDNVEIIPIADFDTEVEALKYEDEMILKYDTINNGFNKSAGAD